MEETPNSGYKEPPALYDCEMCLKKFGESELVGMPSCEHRFCTTCTSSYFNSEIEEHDILACYCPFCVKGEDAKSKEKLFDYFTKLGQILKLHIYSNTFRKFEKKLLRYTDLCIKCYSPVKAPGKYSRYVECQYCSTKACTQCRLLWDNEHYRMSCEQYERALRDIPCHAHNMSSQSIDCVSCGERFLHVRDGTIMFSCPKCEAQMCRSCKSPFYLGVECPEGKDKCCLLFFHAHHPANCLFYLQHKNVDTLLGLLEECNLEPERTSKNSYSCEVEVKKVLRGRTTFVKCGKVSHHNNLGLCKKHAVEFLASIILKNSLDTKYLLDENDEKNFIKRGRKDGLQRKFYGITRVMEENELALKASRSSGNNSDSQSSSLESSSEKTQIFMELVAEASSKTESNVQTQTEVTYPQVPSTSKENKVVAASAPEKACLDCKELPDNNNIFVGKMKEFDARCEDGPEPATAVSRYSFETSNVDQPCDECHFMIPNEKVTKIFGCDHSICIYCIRSNFIYFTTSKAPGFLSCPVCHRPDIFESKTRGLAYLSALSILVKKILPQYQYQKFKEVLKNFVTDLESTEQTPNSGYKEPPALYNCEMCLKKFGECELVGMPSCEHRFCTTCTSSYFNSEIEERDILACYCPFCVKGEDAKSKEKLFEYFTKLGKILKPHLYTNTFRKFEKKLEDLRYTDLCIKCYSPVKAPGKYSRYVECQYCSTKACTQCRLLPSSQHEVNDVWRTRPIRQRGFSSSQSTGAVTRSQVQAAKNSNLTTTQIEGSAGTTADSDKHLPDLLVLSGDISRSICRTKPDSGSAGTTADSDKHLPDLPVFSSDISRSFCRTKPDSYTSAYLEMCKYFEEEEDDAFRDKKVHLAFELTDHGFDLDKAIDAARSCDNFDTATRYLMQKCDSCAKFFSLPEIVQMFMCAHKLCKGCINNHVTKAMKGRNILDCTCKVCEMPKLEFEDKALEYLSTLDCYLESILPSEIHQQFHRELMSGTWKTRLKSKESKVKASGVDKIEEPLEMPAEKKQWECELCETIVDIDEMESLFPCDHKCCVTCVRNYFAVLLRKKTINDCSCPECGQPDLGGDGDEIVQFFSFLRIQLQRILDPQLYDLFTQKLLDRCLNNNPRFKRRPREVVTEASSKTESNVQTQPEVTYPQVPSTSKENEEGAASAPEKACSDCNELPDNSNIFVGKMKEADARCEDGPAPATAVSRYSFDTSNVFQPCDKCHQRVPKKEVKKIFGCDHSICIYCIRSNLRYFTESQDAVFLSCPKCQRPDIFESKTRGLAYLSALSISVEKILDQNQYHKFMEVLQKVVDVEYIKWKECDSKFSSAISSRNSLNDYVEKRHTTCPNCRVHCDLTRQVSMWVECHQCKGSFCGICKAYYNNGCGRSCCFITSFHLHHHKICYYEKDKFGIDKLKIILKENKVDFVDTEPVSGVCLLREVYHCPSKPFRSDLCRYHYEDYLANLILQNNLKTS